jgi:hypothetical protein
MSPKTPAPHGILSAADVRAHREFLFPATSMGAARACRGSMIAET